jgi:hypothetical protein
VSEVPAFPVRFPCKGCGAREHEDNGACALVTLAWACTECGMVEDAADVLDPYCGSCGATNAAPVDARPTTRMECPCGHAWDAGALS